MMVRLLVGLLGIIALAIGIVYWIGAGGPGRYWGAGTPNEVPLESAMISSRADAQRAAADAAGILRPKQILFGDLHVHSTFSLDAFMMAMPTGGGEGAHPVSDACDFARHCSAVDFWSINDHAVALTPDDWKETVAAIRQCNEIAGDPQNPDVSAFLGWEWTQMGTRPENHYGHKNVILRGLSDEEIPTRPIAAAMPADAWDRQPDSVAPGTLMMGLLGVIQPDQDTWDLLRYFHEMINLKSCPQDVPVRDLPLDCREDALTPEGLFAKLDDWGFDSMVIPHGTTWGFYTPHGSSWDKQLRGMLHDPDRQSLIEIFSGHGNSEEYRDWREVEFAADGTMSCPEPRDDFLPSCWRAGEIIETRCLAVGESADECRSRAAEARKNYLDGDVMGHLTVPRRPCRRLAGLGPVPRLLPTLLQLPAEELGAVHHGAAQLRRAKRASALRLRLHGLERQPQRAPGTGYKEVGRVYNTEALLTTGRQRRHGQRDPHEGARPRSVAPCPSARIWAEPSSTCERASAPAPSSSTVA